MTLTLTPEPSSGPSDPPRVKLDLEAPDGGTFTALSVRRGGSLIRRQPFVGASTSLAYDYEAPFGVSASYVATGTVLPVATPDWTEAWTDLTDWSGDTSDWSVSSGEASSSVADAEIHREASGSIQRVSVTDPVLVRAELLTSGDSIVCSLEVSASKVTLTGTSTVQSSGGGSFTLLLSDGTVTASAADSSWSLSRDYSGTPVKVRLVALGPMRPELSTWAVPSGRPLGVSRAGGITYVIDADGRTLIKYNAAGAVVGSWSTVDYPCGVHADGTHVYVTTLVSSTSLVRKFEDDGTPVTSWSATGTPADIWGDGTYLYVCDRTNAVIRKFQPDGTAVTSWSTTDEAFGVVGDGTYIYALTETHIRKFQADGTPVTSWATTGNTRGVAIDAVDGVLYASDQSAEVSLYDLTGTPVDSFTIPDGALSPTLLTSLYYDDAETGLVVADYYNYSIRTFGEQVQTSIGETSVTPVTTPESYSATASTTLNETAAWLIHPSYPWVSVRIDTHGWSETSSNVSIESAQQTTHQQPASVFQPPGRRRAVVFPLGARRAGLWTLVLNAPTLDTRDDIMAALADGAPLLLRSPDWDWDLPDDWYAVGDVTSTRIARPLQQPYRELTLPLTPVDSPPVALVPEWTYGDVLLAAPTYADVLTLYPTYLDVLTGSSA